MKNLKNILFISLLFSASNSVFADWVLDERPQSAGGGYRLLNTDTGQTTATTWKEKRKAKKAARVLNKSDQSVMLDPNGEADYKIGGGAPGF